MGKLKKILIVIIISFVSIYLLTVFVLFNFPFESLFSRLDVYLRTNYMVSLAVGSVKFSYPVRLYLEDVRLVHEKKLFLVSADSIFIRFRLLTFSGIKSFELSGNGIDVQSEFIDFSNAYMNIMSKVKLVRLLRGSAHNQVESVQVMVGGADIERVLLSGFEFTELKLDQVQIFLRGDEEGFTVERGFLKADVMRSELTGRVGYENVDLTVNLALTDDFYRRYDHLSGWVDSVFEDGTMKLKIGGNIRKPRFRVVSKK